MAEATETGTPAKVEYDVKWKCPPRIPRTSLPATTSARRCWSASSMISAAGIIGNEQSVCLRQTSSPSNNTLTTMTLAIGPLSTGFDVTTVAVVERLDPARTVGIDLLVEDAATKRRVLATTTSRFRGQAAAAARRRGRRAARG